VDGNKWLSLRLDPVESWRRAIGVVILKVLPITDRAPAPAPAAKPRISTSDSHSMAVSGESSQRDGSEAVNRCVGCCPGTLSCCAERQLASPRHPASQASRSTSPTPRPKPAARTPRAAFYRQILDRYVRPDCTNYCQRAKVGLSEIGGQCPARRLGKNTCPLPSARACARRGSPAARCCHVGEPPHLQTDVMGFAPSSPAPSGHKPKFSSMVRNTS
jgi:hypothetical protein